MILFEYYAFFPKKALAAIVPRELVGIVCCPELLAVDMRGRVLGSSTPDLVEIKKIFACSFLDNLAVEAWKIELDIPSTELVSIEDFDSYWEVVYLRSVVEFECVEKEFDTAVDNNEPPVGDVDSSI